MFEKQIQTYQSQLAFSLPYYLMTPLSKCSIEYSRYQRLVNYHRQPNNRVDFLHTNKKNLFEFEEK